MSIYNIVENLADVRRGVGYDGYSSHGACFVRNYGGKVRPDLKVASHWIQL